VVSNFDQLNRREFPTNTIGTDYIKKYPGKPDKEFSIRVNAELGKSDAFLESNENTSNYTRLSSIIQLLLTGNTPFKQILYNQLHRV
jgi:glucose-6-phosphate dehydrogenase assembly protein OpcA